MFTKISVLVPTRMRVERLRKMLTSYHMTTRGVELASEIIFRVDDDDIVTQDFLQGHKIVVGPRLSGYVSMPQFYNDMLREVTGDVLLCGNDDMVFKTPRWAPLILEEASRYSDGVFDIGVRTHNQTHYPFSIVSRAAAVRMGFLWDPTIFWGDIFLRDTMAWFDRCVMLEAVQIDHEWAGFNPDSVFLEGPRDVRSVDPVYWEKTHPQAVASAAGKLKEIYDPCLCSSPQAI